MDMTLLFGLRSAPKIFNALVGGGLQWIQEEQGPILSATWMIFCLVSGQHLKFSMHW